MALLSFRWRRILRNSISTILGCGAMGAVGTMGLSALLNWDPSGDPLTPGGAGTWDYTTALWDDNGSLPNVQWNDLTGLNIGVFKGTGALVTLGAPITAGGLQFDVTGYTIGGTALNTLSLVTVGTGVAPIITSNANNVTTAVSASILGNDGLAFTSLGFTGTKTTLSGDNKFIGGLTITSGTVELGNAGALNRSILNTLSFGSSATVPSALLLNGNSVAVRDLTGATNVSSIANGAAGNAILTVYQQSDNLSVKTVLSNGTAGTLELVKTGPSTLTLGSDNTYSGATTVRGTPLAGLSSGTLELAGNNVGRLTATSAINIADGGTLRLTNNSAANHGDRIPTVPVNMRGGTFAFSHDISAASFAETTGALNLLAGTNNVFADQAAATGARTSILTFASLVRSPGSVVSFQSNVNGVLTPSQIGIDTRDQIIFTAAPALNDTMIGGWALLDGVDFATYNTTTFASVKIVTYSAANLDQAAWTAATNVKYDQNFAGGTINLSDITPFTGIRTVNSLNLVTEPISLALNGLILNIDTGGLISQVSSSTGATVDNGFLTAGTAANAELIITVSKPEGALTISSSTSIINNGVGQVNAVGLVKAGPGTLKLQGANAYTGPTSVVGGTLEIDNDNELGAPSATSTLKLYDATLNVVGVPTNPTAANIVALDNRRTLEIGGNSVISVAAGSAGNGKTFTFLTGVILPSTGSLTFLSNANETLGGAVPGTINVTLNAALTLGGSLRIDAATLFRPSLAFPNSIGRSLQIGMNGSATFFQTGSTLTVGSGVDDTLDIGVKDLSTASSVPKIGTMTLTGATQFTAKVDRVRIGVQTQATETVANSTSGTVTLAASNDISAATDITISDNANPNGTTLTASAVTFGAGVNNVTTQNMTIGGRRGTATVTLPANGTLNLKGFAERTLNLSIGRSDLSDTVTNVLSSGTLNASAANTTFTGSFDNLVLGQKTGSTLNGSAAGTLSLGAGAGNFVVANNVKLGVDTDFSGTPTSTTNGTGTLSMAGGSFSVYNDVALGTVVAPGKGSARGNLTITGGTFNVGGNITKTNSDLSNGVITVNGATAQLNMRNPLVGDTTSGTVTASQLIFRQGSITNTASVTLDGRDVTSSLTLVPLPNALIIRDVSLPAPLNLTGSVADKGGVQYENTGNGAGATLASVSLGSVGRTFDIADSAAASADLTVTGAITGAGLLKKTGAGTLQLNGAVAGPISVVTGELGGAGNIAGTVDIGATGALGAGGKGSLGILATGTETFAAGATLRLDINSVAQTSDLINITGNLVIEAGNATKLELNDLNPMSGFTTLFALPILTYTGSFNGAFFTVAGFGVIHDFDAANPTPDMFDVGGNHYSIDYNYGGGKTIAIIAVPEPGSLALVAGGVALLGGMRRRRP